MVVSLTKSASDFVLRINAFDNWLSRGTIPASIAGMKVEFREDWSRVAAYDRNDEWINRLGDAGNYLLAEERKYFGIDWYNRSLRDYVGSIRDIVRPAVVSLQTAVGLHTTQYKQYYMNEWLDGSFIKTLRFLQLPEAVDPIYHQIIEAYLAGYIPYGIDSGVVLVG